MKRKRPGRMLTREQRAAGRAAVASEAERLGPVEVQRRADVAELESLWRGLSTDPVQLAETWLAETDDPGWGIDRAACARQYRRLTGRALTRDEAESIVDSETT
jgi:hypothetical protein